MDVEHILSVIVPMYNGGKTIARCLECILNQSLKNIQIIVVDDASDDDGVKIVKEYIEKKSNIKLISHDARMGPGGARNTGLKYACTEYVAFLDCDDWIDLCAYQLIIEDMEKNKTDIGLCGIKTERELVEQSQIRYSYKRHNILNADTALHLHAREFQSDSSISSLLGNKIFRRTKGFAECQFVNECCFEDDIFVFETLLASSYVSVIPDVYHYYYQRSSSITHNFGKRHIESLVSAFSYLKNRLEERNLFLKYENLFYLLFKRAIAFMLNSLKNSFSNEDTQRRYLFYLYDKLKASFSMKKIVNYIDIEQIRNLFPYK